MVPSPPIREGPPPEGLVQWPSAPASLSAFSSFPAAGALDNRTGTAIGELTVMKHYSFGVAHALVSALTLAGNIMVLLVFLRNSSLRTPTYMFLVSLAFSDLVRTRGHLPTCPGPPHTPPVPAQSMSFGFAHVARTQARTLTEMLWVSQDTSC